MKFDVAVVGAGPAGNIDWNYPCSGMGIWCRFT
jgi:ferredoxin-like protein FixX